MTGTPVRLHAGAEHLRSQVKRLGLGSLAAGRLTAQLRP